MTDLVLTLIGPDRPGLVEAVAQVVAAHDGNWVESRMIHLAGKFAGILRVEVPPARSAAMLQALEGLSARGLRLAAEPDEPGGRDAAAGGQGGEEGGERVMTLDLVGLDRPGLVREVSQVLAEGGVNVEELITDRSSAPMSGEMLFRADIRLKVPPTFDVANLRKRLEHLANNLMIEIRLDDADQP
jgi:glycine cleavage system regulatory protein